MIETSLILLKPDAVQRGLIGELIQKFERTGLYFAGMKLLHPTKDLASKHYEEHVGKHFYEELIEFITEAPVLALAVRGRNAVEICRKIVGHTNPSEASPGTIRGDYCHYLYKGRNLIHASANLADADREMILWFSKDELHTYNRYDAPATIGSQE